MIKATQSDLPLHYMSLFKMPDAIIDRLDRIRRNFLWEGNSDKKRKEKKRLHLMKWDDVIKPRYARGFGIGNLCLKSWALLAKWWRRFGKERDVFLEKSRCV